MTPPTIARELATSPVIAFFTDPPTHRAALRWHAYWARCFYRDAPHVEATSNDRLIDEAEFAGFVFSKSN